MNVLKNGDIAKCNPIEVTDSDVDVTNTEANIVDESEDEDNFIEVDVTNTEANIINESEDEDNFTETE